MISATEHNTGIQGLLARLATIRPLSEAEQYFLDHPAINPVAYAIHECLCANIQEKFSILPLRSSNVMA